MLSLIISSSLIRPIFFLSSFIHVNEKVTERIELSYSADAMIAYCTFIDLSNMNGHGGAVSIYNPSSNTNICFSYFCNCSAFRDAGSINGRGGAVFLESNKISLNLICTLSCVCNGRGNMGYIQSRENIQIEFLSCVMCADIFTGDRSIQLISVNQTVKNINMSRNKAATIGAIALRPDKAFVSTFCTFVLNSADNRVLFTHGPGSKNLFENMNFINNSQLSNIYAIIQLWDGNTEIGHSILLDNAGLLIGIRNNTEMYIRDTSIVHNSSDIIRNTNYTGINITVSRIPTFEIMHYSSFSCDADIKAPEPTPFLTNTPILTPTFGPTVNMTERPTPHRTFDNQCSMPYSTKKKWTMAIGAFFLL